MCIRDSRYGPGDAPTSRPPATPRCVRPDTRFHRQGSLRWHTMAPRNAAISPPRLGDHLQHRPPPPGPRLPDSSRVSGLGRWRDVTDVPDEYTDLTRYPRGTRLNRPNSSEPGGARWRSFGRA